MFFSKTSQHTRTDYLIRGVPGCIGIITNTMARVVAPSPGAQKISTHGQQNGAKLSVSLRNFSLCHTVARDATHKSYAPYSRFHVGAAVLLENGMIFSAGNQENAAFPSGSCAEQSMIYWVGANYPDQQIRSVAVLARPGGSVVFRPVSPCGACRQSLLEYEHRQQQPIRLLMMKPDGGVIVSESISNLLPAKFDADDLRG